MPSHVDRDASFRAPFPAAWAASYGRHRQRGSTVIFEAVIITRNADGSPHVVPMGYREAGEEVVIAPFRPSKTLDNLARNRQAVINLTDNVAIIAGCLTGRHAWPTQAASMVHAARLEDTLVHLEVEVRHEEIDAERPRFYCTVRHREQHRPFKGFNRAQAAVIEAAILVSRLHFLPAERVDSEIAYLRTAVDKTAGEREREAWGWLMERIALYREARSGA